MSPKILLIAKDFFKVAQIPNREITVQFSHLVMSDSATP